MCFSCDWIGSGKTESGGDRVVTREESTAGGGDDGGVELGVDPEERRRLRWTSPRKTLPMLAIKM